MGCVLFEIGAPIYISDMIRPPAVMIMAIWLIWQAKWVKMPLELLYIYIYIRPPIWYEKLVLYFILELLLTYQTSSRAGAAVLTLPTVFCRLRVSNSDGVLTGWLGRYSSNGILYRRARTVCKVWCRV